MSVVQYHSDEEKLDETGDSAYVYVSTCPDEVELHSVYNNREAEDTKEVFVVLHTDAVAALVGHLQSWLARTAGEPQLRTGAQLDPEALK